MSPIAARILLFTAVPALAGCLADSTTRLPSLMVQHPAVEKRAFQIYDPLPDSNLGPDTYSRPREFNYQRTEPRRFKDVERALEIGRQLNPQAQTAPAVPLLGSKYPYAVSP